MKVNDILKKIDDLGVYIELKTEDGASLGFYKKNDPYIVYNNNIKNKNIKNINIQYIQGKRLLVLTLKD